jgi:hypothetical protein
MSVPTAAAVCNLTVSGEATLQTGSVGFGVLQGPVQNRPEAYYLSTIQTSSFVAIEPLYTGAGRHVLSRATPPFADQMTSVSEAVDQNPDLTKVHFLKAAVAGRMGTPVVCLTEYIGAYTTLCLQADGFPAREIVRLIPPSTPVGWGADNFQVLAGPDFLPYLAPPPIPQQLGDFEHAISNAMQAWHLQVVHSVLDPADETNHNQIRILQEWAVHGLSATSIYAAIGGFRASDGRQLAWAPRDSLPLGVHLAKHRLRQVAHISVWANGDLHAHNGEPIQTIAEAFPTEAANAIAGLRSWDLAHLPAWQRAIQDHNWLPSHAVDDVIRYFTTAVTV